MEINSSTWPSLNCRVCIVSDSCGYKANLLAALLERDSLSAISAQPGPRLLLDGAPQGVTPIHNHPQHASSFVSCQSYASSKEASVHFWTYSAQQNRSLEQERERHTSQWLEARSVRAFWFAAGSLVGLDKWAPPSRFLTRQARDLPFRVPLAQHVKNKIRECLDVDSYLASSFVT